MSGKAPWKSGVWVAAREKGGEISTSEDLFFLEHELEAESDLMLKSPEPLLPKFPGVPAVQGAETS